jgi:polyhydroxyalkanoate synthase
MNEYSQPVKALAVVALAGFMVAGCGILDSARSVQLVDRLNPFSWKRTARTHFLKTDDGWTLALERFSPVRRRPGAPPVVLAHGFGHNGAFWSLAPGMDLPGRLAAEGFDVWVVNWRGAGDSTKWVFKFPELAENFDGWKPRSAEGVLDKLELLSDARLANVTTDPRFFSWNFDDYVAQDMPSVLDYITETTGEDQVLWVGHSMGGNAALAYLATHPEEAGRFAGLATIGSQVTMPSNRLFAEYLRVVAATRAASFKGVKGFASAMEAAEEPARELFFRTVNVSGRVLAQLKRVASDPPGLGVIDQYLELVGNGSLKSADKSLDYSRLMGRVKVPVLITAGSADTVAPPVVQRNLFRTLGSEDKEIVLFGREEGFSTDYGHGDPVVGRSAPTEVYPVLIQWLRRHS